MLIKDLKTMDNIYFKNEGGLMIITTDNNVELNEGDLIITKTFPGKYIISKATNENEFTEYMTIKRFRRKKATFIYEPNMKAFIDIDRYSFYPVPFAKDMIEDIINAVLDYKESNGYAESI